MSPTSHTNTTSTPVGTPQSKLPNPTKKSSTTTNSSKTDKNSEAIADSNQPTKKPDRFPSSNTSKTTRPPKPGLSTKIKRIKTKLLSTYYGNPARDMKLICIAGTTGKTTVARFVHDILGSADQQVAIFSSDEPFKAGVLHKFLSDAWKAGATHAVITAPTEVISAQVFHGLPIHLIALTDFSPASSNPAYIDDHLDAYATLFQTSPAHIILNRDDAYYPDFSEFTGNATVLTYGVDPSADLHIDNSKLYKLGSEANLSLDQEHFTVASFLTGEPIIPQMAAAATIAAALHISPTTIADGIATYDPSENN